MNNVINWFEIPVADLDRAIKFYQHVLQITLQRGELNESDMAIFPYQSPATGGALAKIKGIKPGDQGIIIYLHTDDLNAALERVDEAGSRCLYRA